MSVTARWLLALIVLNVHFGSSLAVPGSAAPLRGEWGCEPAWQCWAGAGSSSFQEHGMALNVHEPLPHAT
jgi:hypothetical protein